MREQRGFYCKQYIAGVGFRRIEGSIPEDPGANVVMFEDKGAVLLCNRTEPHEHIWPDHYAPLNPRTR